MEQKRKLKSVDTHFWEDSYVEELDPIEKLIFLYLLTNPNCNLAGIYEVSLKKVAYQTGIDRDMLMKIIERFERDGRAYFRSGRIILPNYPKHQNYNPSMMIAVNRILADLPSELISFLRTLENTPISMFLTKKIEGVDSVDTACLDSASQKESESESESEVKKFKSEATSPTSQNFSFSSKTIQELFKKHSRISEPNNDKHVLPILKILDETYSKNLGETALNEIVLEVFSKLSKEHGVKMEFLTENLRKAISAKHEFNLQKEKEIQIKKAEADRAKEAKENFVKKEQSSADYLLSISQKIIEYSAFIEKNKELFSPMELYEINKGFAKKSIAYAETIILPKMDEMELV